MGMVYNEAGIRIKKCCASCAYKFLNQNATKQCELKMKPDATSRSCCYWKIADKYKNLQATASGTGSVKKIGYLRYVLKLESKKERKEPLFSEEELEVLRREYAAKHGNIYHYEQKQRIPEAVE